MNPFSSIDLLGIHLTLTNNAPVNGIDEELIYFDIKFKINFIN